jgi:glycerol-3-phosphate dehydrogenase
MTSLSTQLLVIGGGATGLGIAWDAALRGLKVVLVEQYDLGQGTSGRYHGLLHSGGRYAISDPSSAVDCARENEILRTIAPHTIEDTGGLFVSTPADPLDFPDQWYRACQELGIPSHEINITELNVREPLLNPRISRAFEVRDASLDSFDLAHSLRDNILDAGGQVMLHHRISNLSVEGNKITGAEIHDQKNGTHFHLDAEVTINAAGPWAGKVAELAGLDIPLSLGKGSMLAMAARMVNTVINRLKPPSDGDIAVPVGTVCVLGTTDIPVDTPESLEIEPWEIDLLLAEGDFIIPGLQSARPLRAWSGIRPLYKPHPSSDSATRTLTRAHALLDHKETDDIEGFISIIGGKLTTFRLMAQETVDLVCDKLEKELVCETSTTPLSKTEESSLFRLPERLERYAEARSRSEDELVICECEIVTKSQIEQAFLAEEPPSLDDLRRDLRLGMGPCQGAFCAYRTAGMASALNSPPTDSTYLGSFLFERWKGLHPLAWGIVLRQMEFMRRVYVELLGDQDDRERQ